MSEKQFLIVGALVVVVFVALFAFLTYQEWEVYTGLQDEVKTLESQIQTYEDKIRKIPDMRERLADLDARFEEKRKILPNKAERENLIDVLNYLCEKTGMLPARSVEPIDVKSGPGRRGATGNIEEILYKVRLKGTFFSFIKFANWLEHYKRHIRMRTFAISGGGSQDTVGKIQFQLDYDVLLVSYQYSGEAGGEEEEPLQLEEPIIPAGDRIEVGADEKRDPFVFPLLEVTEKPSGPEGPGAGETPRTVQEFVEALSQQLDKAEKLRRDVVRWDANATMEQLRSILQRHQELTAWVANKKPLDQQTGEMLNDLRAILKQLDQQIPAILDILWNKRIKQVQQVLSDHLEGRRYADVVAPMLTLVSEFKEYAPTPKVEAGYREVFGQVTDGLTRLVEELSEYQRTIDLVSQIDKEMGSLRNNRLTAVYREFLDGLREIKKKAEDIKLFRDMGITVTGLIWRPVPEERICIVQAQRLRRADLASQKFQRRLFGEGEVIGFLQGESDTVVVKEITRFKKVVFEFRGLSIAQELGEKKK